MFLIKEKMTKSRVKNFFINISHYPILLFASVLMMAKTLVYANGLPVASYGLIAKLILWSPFCSFFMSLGVGALAIKKLPEYYDQAKIILANNIVSLFYVVTLAALVLLQLIVSMLCCLNLLNAIFLLLPIYSTSQAFFLFHASLERSKRMYIRYSCIMFFRGVVLLATLIVSVQYTNRVSALILIETLVNFIFLHKNIQLRKYFKLLGFSLGRLFRVWLTKRDKKTLRASSTLGLTNVILMIYFGLDNILASLLLPNNVYAKYALAAIIFSVCTTIQAIINSNVYTNIGVLIGRDLYKESLRYLNMISVALFAAFVIFIWPVYEILKQIILLHLSKYTASIPIILVLLLSGFFRLADFYTSFLILCDKERIIIFCSILFSLVGCVFLVIISDFWGGLTTEIFAYFSLALSFVMYVSCFLFSHIICFKNEKISA